MKGRNKEHDLEALATAWIENLYRDTSCYDAWVVDVQALRHSLQSTDNNGFVRYAYGDYESVQERAHSVQGESVSSAVDLKFRKEVPLKEWQEFCKHYGIIYSQNTMGGNYYYYHDTQIRFGKSVPNDTHRWQENKPPEAAETICVSTYFMGNLESVALIAKAIAAKWKVLKSDPDPELRRLMGIRIKA